MWLANNYVGNLLLMNNLRVSLTNKQIKKNRCPLVILTKKEIEAVNAGFKSINGTKTHPGATKRDYETVYNLFGLAVGIPLIIIGVKSYIIGEEKIAACTCVAMGLLASCATGYFLLQEIKKVL